MTFPDVQGHCPACGATSLFLADGGYITCSRIECPEPDAVTNLLVRKPAGPRLAVGAVTRELLQTAIRDLARLDPEWWRCELERMARTAHAVNQQIAMGSRP